LDNPNGRPIHHHHMDGQFTTTTGMADSPLPQGWPIHHHHMDGRFTITTWMADSPSPHGWPIYHHHMNGRFIRVFDFFFVMLFVTLWFCVSCKVKSSFKSTGQRNDKYSFAIASLVHICLIDCWSRAGAWSHTSSLY